MPHLPHGPLPYIVAGIVLYLLLVGALVAIRIWRSDPMINKTFVPAEYLQPDGVPTSGEVMRQKEKDFLPTDCSEFMSGGEPVDPFWPEGYPDFDFKDVRRWRNNFNQKGAC